MKHFFASALALAVLSQAAASYAQQPGVNLLPPGEGRDIVAAACTQCHGPNIFIHLRLGPDGWRRHVYDMVLRGAQVQSSELQSVINYLLANFGPGNNVPPAMVQVSLPEGAGKSLVEQRCTLCHGLDRAAGTKRARAEWNAIVSQMIVLGTPLSSDEAKTVTSYLHEKLSTK